MVDPPASERTSCACDDCREHCKQQPGPLIPRDVPRIIRHLWDASRQGPTARDIFVASPGATAVRITSRGFDKVQIGTIVPKRQENGSCVFLDENERCSIHEVAPFGCAFFDSHMGAEEGQMRAKWAVAQQQDRDYQSLRSTLDPAILWTPKELDADVSK